MKNWVKIVFALGFLYVIIALLFWGKKLTSQSKEIFKVEYDLLEYKKSALSTYDYQIQLKKITKKLNQKYLQFLGEGSIFLFFILLSGVVVFFAIRKESKLRNIQKNFVLSFTHELKTPLAGIQLNLQTLKKHDSLTKNIKNELLNNSVAELNRLNSLINNLLFLNKVETEGIRVLKEEIYINELVKKQVQIYRELQHSHNIEFIETEDVYIFADKSMFELILSNLISNAIKYTPNENNITLVLEKVNGYCHLKVKDYGKGIEKNNLDKIFNKFERINRTDDTEIAGTGVGLYIVERFCKLNKIQIQYTYHNNESVFELIWV